MTGSCAIFPEDIGFKVNYSLVQPRFFYMCLSRLYHLQLPEARVRELRGAVVDPQRRLDVIGWAVMGAGGALALGGLVMAAWAKYC